MSTWLHTTWKQSVSVRSHNFSNVFGVRVAVFKMTAYDMLFQALSGTSDTDTINGCLAWELTRQILLTGSEGDFFGTDAVFGGMAILGCVLKCHSLLEVMKFKSDSFLQNIKGSKAEGALFMEMAKRIKAVQAATIWGVNKIRFPGGLSADAYMEKLTSDGVFVPKSEDEGNHMLKRFGSVVNDIRDVLRGRKGNNRQNVMDLLSEVSRGQQSLKSWRQIEQHVDFILSYSTRTSRIQWVPYSVHMLVVWERNVFDAGNYTPTRRCLWIWIPIKRPVVLCIGDEQGRVHFEMPQFFRVANPKP